MRSFYALIAVASLAALASPLAAQRATHEHSVIVTVLDQGKPATGLRPADFAVREDDVTREVLRVEPAAAPMQIALMADTSAATEREIPDIRQGLDSFVTAVFAKKPDTTMTLMSFGDRPTVEREFASSPAILHQGIQRLFSHPGGGAYLLEAIVDAAKALKKQSAKRPVIVAFSSEASTEFSTLSYQQVESALKDSGASLWIVDLQTTAGPETTDEARNRATVLGDVTTRSGGARESALIRTAIDTRFQELASWLTSQTAVVYSRPESLIPPERIDVTLTRRGLRLLAPHWTGQ